MLIYWILTDIFVNYYPNQILIIMNLKRFLLSILAVLVTFEVLNFLIHSVLLSGLYEETASLWREDMMDFMWMMYIADLLFVVIFTTIYTRWVKTPGMLSGILYGLLVGLMMNTVGMLNQFIIYPISANMLWWWLITGLIQFVICGLVLGIIYKPKLGE